MQSGSLAIFVFGALLAGGAPGQAPGAGSAAGQAPAPVSAGQAEGRGVVIGPEDTVTISVLNAEEVSKPWRVSAVGDLNLPMLGRMQVAGMTVEQFEQELTTRLKKYYRDPQVSVFVSEFRSQPVTVIGPVDKPGTHQLEGSRSLFAVLLMAGGPKETAGNTVTLTRAVDRGPIGYPGERLDDAGKYHVVELPIKQVMEGRGPEASIPVQPYDVVAVSESKPQRMVHIAGEVNKPGAVELVSQDTVSLMKVLAMAGGLTRTAAAGKTMIMHLNSQGVQTSTAFVDLKKILAGKAKDLDLSAGDIIIVPSNTFMAYVQAASLSAVTTGVYVLGRF